MKLSPSKGRAEHLRRRLRLLRSCLEFRLSRVCGRCDTLCSCGSGDCTCSCKPSCTEAARFLSSDDAYPIEKAILPLVFALNQSGYFECVWSCGGHLEGERATVPRVWFYAPHVELLDCLISELEHAYVRRRTSARWSVVALGSMGSLDVPLFELRAAEGNLVERQHDVLALSENLAGRLRERIQTEVTRLVSEVVVETSIAQ